MHSLNKRFSFSWQHQQHSREGLTRVHNCAMSSLSLSLAEHPTRESALPLSRSIPLALVDTAAVAAASAQKEQQAHHHHHKLSLPQECRRSLCRENRPRGIFSILLSFRFVQQLSSSSLGPCLDHLLKG